MNEVAILNQLAIEIRFYSQQTTQNIIEVGNRLLEAKKQVPHGEWGKWLDEKVNFTERTAQRFMQCAERFANPSTSTDLTLSQMTELLALPESDTQDFLEAKAAEGKPVEDMTVKTLRQEIKEWKARAETAEQERDKAISTAESYEADNEVLRQSNKELANRDPVVVEITPSDYEESKRKAKTLQTSYDEQARLVNTLKRENAELKAHQNGMTLQESANKAKPEEETKRYVKTEIEERQEAEILWKLMDYMAKLPASDIEMREVARCFLKHNEDMREYMDGKLQDCIRKLELLSEIFQAKATLTLVK